MTRRKPILLSLLLGFMFSVTVVTAWVLLLPFFPGLHVPAVVDAVQEMQISEIKRLEGLLLRQAGASGEWLDWERVSPELKSEFQVRKGRMESRVYVRFFGHLASNTAKAVYIKLEFEGEVGNSRFRWSRSDFNVYTWDDVHGRFLPVP